MLSQITSVTGVNMGCRKFALAAGKQQTLMIHDELNQAE